MYVRRVSWQGRAARFKSLKRKDYRAAVISRHVSVVRWQGFWEGEFQRSEWVSGPMMVVLRIGRVCIVL